MTGAVMLHGGLSVAEYGAIVALVVALGALAVVVSALLWIVVHESSHAAAILASGHRVAVFRPWPHRSVDSFGRRTFWWGRASSGTQSLGPVWEPTHHLAPLVPDLLALALAGSWLLAGAEGGARWAWLLLFGCGAVDSLRLLLQPLWTGRSRRGDLHAAAMDLGWSRGTTRLVGALAALPVAGWAVFVIVAGCA